MRRGRSKGTRLPCRNIRLILEYDGAAFNGWQLQHPMQRTRTGRVRTVQGELEAALRKVFGRHIRVSSSSRTDSGVHASGHVANFKTTAKLDTAAVKAALNRVLPRDAVVLSAAEAPAGFDARKDALCKLYRYSIWNSGERAPLHGRYTYHFRQPLDVPRMRRASGALTGRHNFAVFESSSGSRGATVRTVRRITVSRKGCLVTVDIEADGFLYNMARNITGFLIEVGRGRFGPDIATRLLGGRDCQTAISRRLVWQTVPARGLCLIKVRYRDLGSDPDK